MEKQVEYQLIWDYVDKLTNRRQNINTTYLSVNAAIITVIAFLLNDATLTGWLQLGGLVLLLIAGIIVSDQWRRQIVQYKLLIRWWYQQLREMERQMTQCSALASREYHELYKDGAGQGQIGLTRYETTLTWVFIALYLVFIIATFVFAEV